MTKTLIFGLVGLLLLIFRSILIFRLPIFSTCPDLVLILVVYLGIFRNPIRGLIIVFVLGLLADLTTGGGYQGLTSLSYLIVFLAARLAGKLFYARNPLIQGIITLIANIVHGIFVHWLLFSFAVLPGLWPVQFKGLLIQAFLSGLFAPLVFYLLLAVERIASLDDQKDTGIGGQTWQRSKWAD